MADRTLQILPGGQSSAPFTYTLPASTAFTLLAVRAVFDGTAAGAFLPCVQLVSDAGVVMAETIGSSVSAGGSADVSFFPLRRGTTAAATNYAQLVGTISAAGNLRGYWRMGETSSTFKDTSGYEPLTPQDLTITGTGSNTRGVLGCVAPDQDDLAWQLNVKGNPSPGDVSGVASGGGNPYPGTQTSFTIVAWIRPTATVGGDPAWTGAVYANENLVAGAPSYVLGWALELRYPGGATSPIVQFTRSNDAAHGSAVTCTGPSLAAGTDYMIGATFDGATITLYVNGLSVATQADTARGIPEDQGVSVGRSPNGQYYGVADEISLWASVLSASDMARLYLAGTS